MRGEVISVANLQYQRAAVDLRAMRHYARVVQVDFDAKRENRRHSADVASSSSSALRADRAMSIRDQCASDAARHAASASHSLARGCKCNAF